MKAKRALVCLFATLTAFATFAQPVVPGLTHRYSFTSNAVDSIAGANGTLLGNAAITNRAVKLDGVNSYVDLPDNLLTNFNSITFEFWVTDNGSSTWARILDFGNSTGSAGTQYIFLSLPATGNILRGAFTTNGSGAEQLVNASRPAVGQPSHIVWQVDADTAVTWLWLNGSLVGASTINYTPAIIGPTLNDWLGRSQFSGDPFFNGTIDEFRIYDYFLDSSTIFNDYQNGPNHFGFGSVYFVADPQSTNVLQARPVTFTADVDGTPPFTLQWYRNGQPMPGENGLTLSFSAQLTNNNDTYQLFATNNDNGTDYSASSAIATLMVTPDTNPPVLLRAAPASTNAVNLFFSEAMRPDTATNLANYTLTGPGGVVAVSNAVLDPNGLLVTLTTAPQLPGSNYTVTVSGLRDLPGNLIAPASQASYVASVFILWDVGAPAILGTFLPGTNQILSAAGTGIGGTNDQFSFGYKPVTGDFDIQLRLGSLGLVDPWSVAGIMARDGLDTNNPFAASLATPGPAGCLFESRTNQFGTATTAGFFPVNYPDTWLRLKRVGNQFTGYASFDGATWSQLGTVAFAASATLQVGIAVSSHNAALATTALTSNYGNTSNTTVANVPLPFEPIGPSSRRTGLAISEIMYHPQNLTNTNTLEFVEIYNSDLTYEDMSGYRLAGSVDYTFPPGTILAAGAYLVIARDPAAVQTYYGITGVLGPFTNNLPNNNGTVRLRNELDSVLLEVNYDSKYPWPISPDGAGHSLVLRRASYGEADPRAWAPSDTVGGTPGRAEPYGAESLRSVVINEILAHTDFPQVDTIELFNASSTPLNLNGCTLSDDPDTNKYTITNVIIPARGCVFFTETQLGFSLNAAGESLFLRNPSKTRVLDAVHFDAQENGLSIGRYPDGSDQWYRLRSMTFGGTNDLPLRSDIVINEIMYNPLSGNDDDQYVELYNRGSNSVDLSGWSFVAGISFTIPANTFLPINSYLVVARNAARLESNYPQLNFFNTLGDFGGKLSHNGERLALAKPDTIVSTNGSVVTTNLIAIVVDEVTYGTGGRWGQWADGGGSSLELTDPNSDGRLAANWADSDETTKAPWTLIQRTDIIGMGETNNAGAPTTQGVPSRFELFLQGAGECLVDDVEVRTNGGPNLVTTNAGFESGTNAWAFQGSHVRTSLETNLAAFSGSNSLHVRATLRGDTGANRVRTAIPTIPTALLTGTNQATLRARVRWLRGNTNIMLRIRGNWLECAGGMTVPLNLGTPGLPNSRLLPNAGPAIFNVTHFPILPATNDPVVVTARVADSDGVASVTLFYRLDPSVTYSNVSMLDNGTGGDAFANDRIYSATIPAPATNARVAFYVQAVDANGSPVTNRFPSDAPARECLINYGEPVRGVNIGSYRMWLTQANLTYWGAREKNSNEGLDTTFVYGSWRVVYNALSLYSGSPFHTPSYNGPLGSFVCNYNLETPVDDIVLGYAGGFDLEGQAPTDSSTFNNDASASAENTAHWMARKLGIQPDYRRHVLVYMNGQQRGMIYYDYQQPDGDILREYFPDDPNGHLYKIEDWFEFADNGATQNNNSARMREYNLGGKKHIESYRWNFRPRATDAPNDFAELFTLIDAVNAPAPEPYTSTVQNLADVPEFMRMWALEHMAGDWDSWGYERGKNMFIYKPTKGPWRLLLWDIQLVFGKSSRGTSDSLFNMASLTDVNQGGDPLVMRMFNHPPFAREYWAGLQELVNGPMLPQNYYPLIDARSAALLANNVPVKDSAPVKAWIDARRAFIAPQIPQATFGLSGSTNFSTSANNATLTGFAPIGLKDIFVNGSPYDLTWSSSTSWSLRVALNPGSNVLTLQGRDKLGNLVTNGTIVVTINYTGGTVSPVGNIVINEIMHHPPVDGAEYVELYNNHGSYAFDLSNWRLNGLDYTFPPGSTLLPQNFLVVTKDRFAYNLAYGVSNAPFDQYTGNLQGNGETITLIQPGATPLLDVEVAKVKYETNAPWPALATQPGTALQLVDATRDNWRAGNWKIGQPNPPPPVPQWIYETATGAATSSTLYVYLQTAGDIHLDDMKLVAGTVPESGPNFIANGDFETTWPGPWNLSANMTASTNDKAIKHTGIASLHMIASSGGSTQSNSIYQVISPALTNGSNYTLSFWYLQSSNGGPLVVRLSGGGLGATNNPAPPVITPALGATPGTNNSVTALIPVFQTLWINELQADNLTGITNSAGQRTPWIELYNPSGSLVSLNGLYLSSDYSNLTTWAFPSSAVINPGQFKVIFVDGQTNLSTSNELHTGFTLPSGSGSIALTRLFTGQPQVLDYINYENLTPNRSYGSFPDAQAFDRQEFFFVTPGGTNNGTSPTLTVKINEWMADNTHTIANPVGGKFDDWFELYNYGSNTVDLNGYYLTDNLSNKLQILIPAGFTIPPHGFQLVWADNKSSTNSPGLHVNFALSKGGEAIGLFASDGTAIDYVTFGPQTSDVSMGRYTDGGPLIYFMNTPTPGNTNVFTNSAPGVTPVGNRTITLGQTLSLTAAATDLDAPPQILTFSLGAGSPPGASIVTNTGLLTWSPSTAPATNTVRVIVTDNGVPALSGTNTFQVFVVPPPSLLSGTIPGNQFVMSWQSVNGTKYQVVYKDDLNIPGWNLMGGQITGNGSVMSVTNSVSASDQRYFCLQIVP